jgi:hypothetical protein
LLVVEACIYRCANDPINKRGRALVLEEKKVKVAYKCNVRNVKEGGNQCSKLKTPSTHLMQVGGSFSNTMIISFCKIDVDNQQ